MSKFIQIPICNDITDKGIIIPQSTAVCITAITDVRIWKQPKGKERKGDGLLIPEGVSRVFAIGPGEWETTTLIIQGSANIGFDNGSSGIDLMYFLDRVFDVTFDDSYN